MGVQSSHPDFDAILPLGNERPLHICWFLHNHCSHRCSYCHESNWNGSFQWLALAHVKSFVDQVRKHYGRHRTLISFTGGEPTLWPDFEECVDHLSSGGFELGMTSNGAQPLEYFERIAPHFSWISLSFHPEFTRTEKFLNLIDRLSELTALSVRIMLPCDDKLGERSIKFREDLERAFQEGKIRGRVHVELVKTVEGFGTILTSPLQYEGHSREALSRWPPKSLLRDGVTESVNDNLLESYMTHQLGGQSSKRLNFSELLDANRVNFQNWTCNIGLEQLFVGSDGYVFRSGCGVGNRLGRIGHRIDFPVHPVRCWKKNFCHCGTDVAVSKVSPEWVKLGQDPINVTDSELRKGAQRLRTWHVKVFDVIRQKAFELEVSTRARGLRGKLRGLFMILKHRWLAIRWSRRWRA